MILSKRIQVVFSIVGYVLATTAVHALHDHSAHTHHNFACSGPATEEIGEAPSPGSSDGGAEHSHHHPFAPTCCDESCFACRLLAVKCVASSPFAVIPSIAPVYLIEQPARPFFPVQRLSQPLSRGPPSC